MTAIAWDIDGANAANSIAMDASQAAKQRFILSIRILKLYQWSWTQSIYSVVVRTLLKTCITHLKKPTAQTSRRGLSSSTQNATA